MDNIQMININKFFYYDNPNLMGIIKIPNLTSLKSQSITGDYLHTVLKNYNQITLECKYDFILSLNDEDNGCKLFSVASIKNKIYIKIKTFAYLLKNKHKYQFELFSTTHDNEIKIDFYQEQFESVQLETLCHFAFPSRNFPKNSQDLFYKGQLYFYRKENKNFTFLGDNISGGVDFNTYFNSFEVDKWVKATDLKKLYINFNLKGEIILRIKTIKATGVYSTNVLRLISLSDKNFSVQIPFEGDEIVGVHFYALKPSILTDIKWSGILSNKNANEINQLAIIITAFNEPDVISNCKLLAQEIKENCPNVNFKLFIIDNSQSINKERLENIKIIYNQNLGGTGGFIRGLLEARKEKFSFCMFMDDDAYTSPYSIEKSFNFLKLSKNNNVAISGAMFDKNNVVNQLESGAYFFEGCHPLHCNLHGADPITLLKNNIIDSNIKIYGSWWFFMFKINDDLKLPFPYFVRGDDIDFSYKNNFNIYLLNGVCSWQDNFITKETPVAVFLFIRSHILHHLTINFSNNKDYDVFKSIEFIVKSHLFRYLKQFRYDLARAVLEACVFICQGKDNWTNNLLMEEYLRKVKQISLKESTQKEQEEYIKTYDFYKQLRLWPVTKLTKKYTINSILIPRLLKSHKIWEIPQGNYVDPKYLFLKNFYIQKNVSGKIFIFKFNLLKTLKIILYYGLIMKRFNKKYLSLKMEYKQSYDEWSEVKKWEDLFNK